MATTISCPNCGKVTNAHLDNCVHCGGALKKAPRHGDTAAPGRSQTCPNCGALVQEGDIICVACGTNLLTGQQIVDDRPLVAEPESSGFPWLVVGLCALVVLVLIILAVVLLGGDAVGKAEELIEQGQTLEALEILDKHLEKKPDDARGQFLRGKLHWLGTQYEHAAKSLDQAATLDPTNEDAAVLAALSYAKLGDDRQLAKAVAVLEPLVARSPANGEAWQLLAQVRGAQGDTSGQIDALRRAVTLRPAEMRPLVSLGIARAVAGEYAAAAGDLAKGASADAAAAAGMVAALQGNAREAGASLDYAVKGETAIQKEALVQLGMLQLAEGSPIEASAHFGQALRLSPGDGTARFFNALCFDAQGNSRDALTDLESLSKGGGAYAADASVQMARIYLRMNETGLALEAADRALGLGAEGVVYHTTRGRIYAATGEADRAREAIRAAIKADPQYAPAHLENGLLYVQLGMPGEGIQELRRYLELVDPSLPDALTEQVRALVDHLQQTMPASQRTGSSAGRIAS